MSQVVTLDGRPTDRAEQARAALRNANRIRSRRARFRRQATVTDVIELIENPPEWARTWQLAIVLRTAPMVGEHRARQVCNRARVPYSAQIGRLSLRQRSLLVYEIRRRWGKGEAA